MRSTLESMTVMMMMVMMESDDHGLVVMMGGDTEYGCISVDVIAVRSTSTSFLSSRRAHHHCIERYI